MHEISIVSLRNCTFNTTRVRVLKCTDVITLLRKLLLSTDVVKNVY